MLCGLPPFYKENHDRMYDLIKLAEVKFPKKINLNPDARDIITKLLDKNPNTRLGSKNGINEIKTHPFFSTIDFDLVLKKKVHTNFFKNKFSNLNFFKIIMFYFFI